jgi:hypothetical protein
LARLQKKGSIVISNVDWGNNFCWWHCYGLFSIDRFDHVFEFVSLNMFATLFQFLQWSIHVSVLLSIAIAGASVHTYRKAGRHIVVLEDDKVIFNSILKPLTSEPLTEVVKKQRLDKPVVTANSDDEEELPAPIIVR